MFDSMQSMFQPVVGMCHGCCINCGWSAHVEHLRLEKWLNLWLQSVFHCLIKFQVKDHNKQLLKHTAGNLLLFIAAYVLKSVKCLPGSALNLHCK